MDLRFEPMSDHGVIITCGDALTDETFHKVVGLLQVLEQAHESWIVECIPGYINVTVLYDPMKIFYIKMVEQDDRNVYTYVVDRLQQLTNQIEVFSETDGQTIAVPVCYGGMYGPDLSYVANYHGLTEQEVISIHTSASYRVHMIGFAPGFPYLGGLSEQLATPRKDVPRKQISAGSVGIAGSQTGVYPLATPGGWQLLGRTPVALFDPASDRPFLVQPGDSIQFYPITELEYQCWEEEK